ncbi:MAG: glycosyltransferase family 4 protein [Chloroflexota bacterium]
MKIALVSPYDFAYPGGVLHHILALERHFTRMGHEVKIIAPASQGDVSLDGRLIPIGRPRAVPTSGSIARITLSIRLASQIKEVLAREKFDIVHLHEPFMPMLCSAVLRFSDTANVGTFHACHGRPGYKFGRPISTFMLNRRAPKLAGKIAVSRPAADFAGEFVPGDYTIIPNGVDLEHFSPDVAPFEEFRDGKLNILFVGRLEYRKGFDYLLAAYRWIKPEFPDCRIIVVGPGTRLRGKYERRVAKCRLEDVVFIGHSSYDDLPRYYQTADIFCSPATGRESFGIVLLEAMALGKPIVASNIEGYASVVSDGVEGLLVPPKNDRMLAQALLSLMKDEALRRQIGERGRLKVREYSWDRVARRLLKYYSGVLSQPPWDKRRPEGEASLSSALAESSGGLGDGMSEK